MKRCGCLVFLLLLTGESACAEAFKNHNLEGFLGGAFLLLLGAPAAVGLGVYGVLHLNDPDYTANLALTVFMACVTWWFGLFILFDLPANPGRFWFLEVCMSAAAAAVGYYGSREQKPDL